MGFISTNISLDEVLRNLHQDYLYMNLSIHDELDTLQDKNLMEGLSYELSKHMENKRIFDSFGFKFMNVYFDFEYNKANGSFSTNNSFDPTEIRIKEVREALAASLGETPKVESEKSLVEESKEDSSIEVSLTKPVPVPTPVVETGTIDSVQEIKVYLNKVKPEQLEELSSIAEGDFTLLIDVNGKYVYKFERKIRFDKTVLNKYNYKLL